MPSTQSGQSVPYRDGQPYDLVYRTRLATRALKESRPKQPRHIARPAGPHGGSAVVGLISNQRSMLDLMVTIASRYPRIAYMKMAGEHLYVLTHPDTILEVMHSRSRDLIKSRGLQVARSILGEGLLTSEGEMHLRQRRMIQPAFHKERIESYAAVMVDETATFQSRWSDGQSVNLATDMSAMTLAIVGKTLFGSDLTGDAAQIGNAINEVMATFQRRLLPGAQLYARIPTAGNKRLQRNVENLDAIVQRLIIEHRRSGDTGDLLSMMIAAQDQGFAMDDAQLRDEAMTLVLAGHETTAMTLTWAFYLLTQNPDAAAKVLAEVDAVAGDRAPDFGDLSKLPQCHALIAETMRLFPPAWVIGRRTTVDLEVDGWTIPAGSGILASQFAMHRDPRFWQAASECKPERWITDDGTFDENAPGQPRGAWFPFGFGNRRCIGDTFAWTEAVLALATISRRWTFELQPNAEVELKPEVTLRPRGGMPMIVRARQN